jgi:acyl-CoA thioesterase-1
MKKIFLLSMLVFHVILAPAQQADKRHYLDSLKRELNTRWPHNRTINLVFHGHSVPAGYWHNSEVHTMDSYPHLVLSKVKESYPHAVVNVIVTAIGGEHAVNGQKRMAEVLDHRPDVLFIDYALNDRGSGLDAAKVAWEAMINEAVEKGVKVILMTPSPDQRQDILDPANPLVLHAAQIRELASIHQVGLVDPFVLFQNIAREEGSVQDYMSHVNHPNRKGHELIAEEIVKWF